MNCPTITAFATFCGVFCAVPSAHALTFEVLGTGAVPVATGASPNEIRERATTAAKRHAVETAIDKILGADASTNPKVAAKVGTVVAQIPESAIVGRKSRRVGNSYEVTLRVVFDDKRFRILLSDLGIAINTSTTRSFSILAIMDEFLTSPRDVKAPIEELTEFRRDTGGSFRDKSKTRAQEKSSGSGAVRVATSSGRVHGRASARSSSSSKSSNQQDVSAQAHDKVSYRKLIRYQPQGGSPERVSQTYNALVAQFQDYDLKMLDNDVFRSRFFKDKPLTIQELQNSKALSAYTKFAKDEANADFFMMGTSIIIDSGVSETTGERTCSGVVTVKTYSTVSGESIASETASETAAGQDINACAGNLALKLARIAGGAVAARVQQYWKRRSMYGRDYVVTLVGHQMPLMTRIGFLQAIKKVQGVENARKRVGNGEKIQVAVTYLGEEALDAAIAMGLASDARFSKLDARSEGSNVLLCLGPCSGFDKGVKAKRP